MVCYIWYSKCSAQDSSSDLDFLLWFKFYYWALRSTQQDSRNWVCLTLREFWQFTSTADEENVSKKEQETGCFSKGFTFVCIGFWAELVEVLSFYRIAKPNGGRHYLETQGQVSWNHFSCERVFFLNNRNRALLHPEMSVSWWCARKSTNQTGLQMWVLTWLVISHLTCPGFLIRKMETIVDSQRHTVVKQIMSVSVLETKGGYL